MQVQRNHSARLSRRHSVWFDCGLAAGSVSAAAVDSCSRGRCCDSWLLPSRGTERACATGKTKLSCRPAYQDVMRSPETKKPATVAGTGFCTGK